MCICCQEVACHPVTTPCAHNICKVCCTARHVGLGLTAVWGEGQGGGEWEGQGKVWSACTRCSPPFQSCLQRSFKAEVYNCPNCRHSLPKDLVTQVNTSLQQILIDLFPGYAAGR